MERFRPHLLPIAIGGLGLILIIIGLIQFLTRPSQKEPLVFEQGKEEQKQEVVVDIEGAVIKPGVYKLSSDNRTVDALAAAGGLSEEADRNWVEKNINLAKKVTDGLKIYIPRSGEQVLSENSVQSLQQGGAGPVINLNTASQSDLESLPGIGAVTAQKIIEARPYTSIEELLSRKVVGQSTYDKIKDKIAAN